jgi:hypothetical protein
MKWDDNSQSCKVYSSVKIRVVYYRAGYTASSQNYVMEVTKYAVEEDWKYPDMISASQKVNFDHFIQV